MHPQFADPTYESTEIQSAYQECCKLIVGSEDINKESLTLRTWNYITQVSSAARIGGSVFPKQEHSKFANQFIKQHVVKSPVITRAYMSIMSVTSMHLASLWEPALTCA